MEKKNQFKTIDEGKIKLIIPDNFFIKGPGKRSIGFYNMDQKLNRDFTISFLRTVKPKLALDAFGGTGIRGLRINREANIKTVITEINKGSFNFIENNREYNNLNVEIYNKSFQSVLNDYLFDYIDIDPYGSVLPYMDDALINIRNKGYIGITATDLTALTGSMERKTKRRYHALILNDNYRHESGIRLLISEIIKRAASMDKAAFPMLSLWHSHYYRVIFQIFSSANMADELLNKINYVNKNNIISDLYNNVNEGPLWSGNLNSDMVNNLDIIENPDKLFLKYLNRIKNSDLSYYFLELSDIAKFKKIDTLNIEKAIDLLERNNIKSGRTIFSDTGLKIDYNLKEAIKYLY